jgi:hypothetical protein
LSYTGIKSSFSCPKNRNTMKQAVIQPHLSNAHDCVVIGTGSYKNWCISYVSAPDILIKEQQYEKDNCYQTWCSNPD